MCYQQYKDFVVLILVTKFSYWFSGGGGFKQQLTQKNIDRIL